jgi:hypothetical protein
MSSTFAGVALPEIFYEPLTKPLVKGTRLTSGYLRYQTSTVTDKSWKVSVLCTAAQLAAILALLGTVGSLVLEGTTHTNCLIDSAPKIKEINPSTWEVSFTVVKDGSL